MSYKGFLAAEPSRRTTAVRMWDRQRKPPARQRHRQHQIQRAGVVPTIIETQPGPARHAHFLHYCPYHLHCLFSHVKDVDQQDNGSNGLVERRLYEGPDLLKRHRSLTYGSFAWYISCFGSCSLAAPNEVGRVALLKCTVPPLPKSRLPLTPPVPRWVCMAMPRPFSLPFTTKVTEGGCR